jgi:hypothetical protein
MTLREISNNYPQNEGESVMAYAKRLTQIAFKMGLKLNSEASRQQIMKWRKVSRKLDKNGNETSSIERFQAEAPEIPEGFIPTKITKTQGDQHWITYTKESNEFELTKELIAETVKGLDIKPIKLEPKTTGKILRLIYSDTHIGMETDSEGTAMYPIKWGESEVMKLVDKMLLTVNRFIDNHESIHVIDLGDFLDGYNGQTTRGGHALPQNMSNAEAFKVGAKFKITLAKGLAQFGVPLYFHNIVNDNHAGDFAELVNFHVKEVLSYMIPDSTYYIQRKFIEHYDYGKHSFVLTHGKDKKYCIRGLSSAMDKRVFETVTAYINNNKLCNNVTFEKGDSHVSIIDKSKTFNYICYPSVAPASEWVQTNFNKGRQMFAIMEVYKDENNINPLTYEV